MRIKPKASTKFDKANTIRLEGAHGDEIVRSVCFKDGIEGTVFTAGEDGSIKAWRVGNQPDQAKNVMQKPKTKKTSKREATEDDEDGGGYHPESAKYRTKSMRFKPY